MASSTVFDSSRNAVTLGKELGRGGEGAVFDIQGRPDAVAKIYLKPPSPFHSAKLMAMTEMATDQILRLAAWPVATLHDRSGSAIGFIMPKVSGFQPAFKLYGPKLRLQEFPQADWRFLIHAAANMARAFAVVHASGFVIGDVNHGNLVVDAKATVRLWDCDSFQISRGRETWFCEVGVGTHQPPEMQIPSYKGVVRTPNHDNFGLAVLIFQLLCMNRHPFMGRYSGPGETPSIEEAIAQSRYAYSRDRSRTGMAPPHASLPMEALTPEIRDLFEAAFAPSARNGGRPAADSWVPALQRLGTSLRTCPQNQSHHFLSSLPKCPWCDIEAVSGALLFPVSFVAGAGAGVGIAALWQEVTQTREPAPLPPLREPAPALRARAPRAARHAHEVKLQVAAWLACPLAVGSVVTLAPAGLGAALLACSAAAGGLIIKLAKDPAEKIAAAKLAAVRAEWAALQTAWNAGAAANGFSPIMRELESIKRKHDELPGERAKRLQRLSEQARDRQFANYLDSFPIASAKISGIGRAKVATLASHGIDTAGDINFSRIIQLPGFGTATANKLVAWRKTLEQAFRFDPKRGIPQSDIAAVERDIALARQTLERDMKAGLGRLKAMVSSVETQRRALQGKAAELAPKYAQAAADATARGDHSRQHKWLIGLSAVTVCLVPLLMLLAPNVSMIRSPLNPAPVLATERPPLGMVPRATAPMPPPVPEATPEASSAPAPQAAVQPTETATMKQSAWVRQGPSNAEPAIGTALAGTVFTVYDRRDGWVRIGRDSPWGWVYSGMLETAR